MGYVFTKETQAFLNAMNQLNIEISNLVTVAGSVIVTNFPSNQQVSGTFWPSIQSVSGSLTTTPFTSGTATITVSPTITTTAVKIIGSNPNRKGLSLYNQSANSIYLTLGGSGTAGPGMSFILGTFAHLSISQLFPQLIWTGEVWGIHNTGATGTVGVTELT